MNRKNIIGIFAAIFMIILVNGPEVFGQDKGATVRVTFKNVVKDTPVVLYDATYTNSFGEDYTINKFRYYISNIFLQQKDKVSDTDDSIYLIDEAKEESKSFTFSVPTGEYATLDFQIGVDSIFNVSGAQTGALDPTKDMFWTWNTGYVMAKLEGNSPASNVVNQKYEFHIGGFSGKYNVLKNIKLFFPENKSIHFVAGKTTEIMIVADVDAWFQNPNEMKIADKPAINSPGKFAVLISENYANMFSIDKIVKLP